MGGVCSQSDEEADSCQIGLDSAWPDILDRVSMANKVANGHDVQRGRQAVKQVQPVRWAESVLGARLFRLASLEGCVRFASCGGD